MSMRNRSLFTDKQRKNQQPQIIKKYCNNLHPCISSPPTTIMSEAQFNFQYTQFTTNLPIMQQVKDNLKYLYQLFWHICQFGGLVSVISNHKFDKIIEMMSIKFPEITQHTQQNILEHYVKFQLFSFQAVLKTGKRLDNDKLICLQPAKYIPESQICKYLQNFKIGVKLYDEDIVVLRQLCSAIKIQQPVFNISKIKQICQNDSVKVMIQVSDVNQFSWRTNEQYVQNIQGQRKIICQNYEQCPLNPKLPSLTKLLNQQQSSQNHKVENIFQIPFSEFYKYYSSYPHQTFQQRHQTFKLRLPSLILNDNFERVMYAIQLDSKDDFFINQMHKRLNGSFLCFKQNFDFLSYIDEDISGVTLPYFDFQLEGNWCGGRQQTYGMCKIDINLGQSSTEWYCISGENLNKLQILIKKQFNTSLEKIEGDWFQEIDWFIERKIPIKKIIQKSGDAIIIGSGSLYWFKSKGKSTHISWSIMPMSQKQIKSSLSRLLKLKQNYLSADFKTINRKIPIKSIFLRVLNHLEYAFPQKQQKNPQFLSLSSLVIIRQSLRKWYVEEQKNLNQLIVRRDLFQSKYKYYYIYDAESYCGCCNNQILNYFMNNNGLLSCLQCICKIFVSKKQTLLKDNTIYFKYQSFWLYHLIYLGNLRMHQKQKVQYLMEFEQICQGQFNCLNMNCCKSNGNISDKSAQRVQEQYEWNILMNHLKQKQQNSLQHLLLYKIQTLISRTKTPLTSDKIQDQQNIPFHAGIQTNMSLLCPTSDQQIVELVAILAQAKKQNSFQLKQPDNNETCVSLSSILRKAKRALHHKDSSQPKSQTQYSDEIFKTKTSNYDQKQSPQKTHFKYISPLEFSDGIRSQKRKYQQGYIRKDGRIQKQKSQQKIYRREKSYRQRRNYVDQRQEGYYQNKNKYLERRRR